MTKTKENKRKVNFIAVGVAAGIMAIVMLLLSTPTEVYAAPRPHFNQGQGRTGGPNVNDFHTAEWERFSFNYQFTSGSDHRFELGRPTTFNGFVPIDVHTSNFRRDSQVSLRPPRYGVFSGHVPTAPSNNLFPQPLNPNFGHPTHLHSPNLDPRFDTLHQGVNAQPTGNPASTQNTGTGGFLPPTSIN